VKKEIRDEVTRTDAPLQTQTTKSPLIQSTNDDTNKEYEPKPRYKPQRIPQTEKSKQLPEPNELLLKNNNAELTGTNLATNLRVSIKITKICVHF